MQEEWVMSSLARRMFEGYPAFRKSIYEYAPDSNGSKDYDALTDEVLQRLKMGSGLRVVKEVGK